eukprot:9217627-Alexandrium_andersonii.AAC.1
MSASLVGSEMCIRDRGPLAASATPELGSCRGGRQSWRSEAQREDEDGDSTLKLAGIGDCGRSCPMKARASLLREA